MLSWESSSSVKAMRRDRAWVEIDLQAVAHNVRQIRSLLALKTELMAVVKADAYGHGAVTIARTVLRHGASWLGVATIPEGIELREAGIDAPILLLGATNTPDQVKAIARWKLQPTICTPKQVLIFAETLTQPIPVHLKLDTGMSRLGAPWQDAVAFAQMASRSPNLQLASVYSHLATADDPDPAIMRRQQQRYERAIAALRQAGITPPRLHLANSAATLSDRRLHYDLVRTGLAVYGLHPAPHLQAIDLQPVMQIKARVTQVKSISAGTGVSYGHKFVADREMTLATVAIGYADGVPRNLSNQMEVLIRGVRVPQVGAITMDQLMLDVSAVPNLQEGEVVTLIGQDGRSRITADDWANKLGTISWEILCSFKHRLPRLSVNSPMRVRSEELGVGDRGSISK
ncbi:alanine racemase [Microcoleus sp. FACHB-1515]|uniref:alanine racemase n=1 Tax=Cyanophyceae TaxID=3028117 RepID=UPI001689B58D|nr:alanine racemase [Microcoleus sp. FACHB-1515]MBD2089153.1 alanine racemase [Microcoleus sp. FACHB-1515]